MACMGLGRISAYRAARATPGAATETVEALKARIGSDDFYRHVALLDPRNASRWRKMVDVQARFKAAEAGYPSRADRTYSESNRETLHRVTIQLLKHRKPGQDVYKNFVELHPTLFKENGACALPLAEQLQILANTDPAMFSLGNSVELALGLVVDETWKPLVQRAAQQTRAARRARGLPVTVSGYR